MKINKCARGRGYSHLYNRSLNATFASRPLLRQIKISLKKNLNTVQSLTELEVNNHVDSFMSNNVIVDMHRIHVDRNTNNEVVSITPLNTEKENDTGKLLKYKNGLPLNCRDRRGVTLIESFKVIPKTVFVLVTVTNYSPEPSALHKNHAISAFVSNGVLYCFNSWGSHYITKNKRTGKVLPDDHIWTYLKERYKCKSAVVYTGYNFQKHDIKGACGGFASDFGTHMYNYALQSSLNLFPHTGLVKPLFRSTEKRGAIHHSKEFNIFVPQIFKMFAGAFGNGRYGCNTLHNDLFYGIRMIKIPTSVESNDNGGRTRKTVSKIDLLKNLNKISKNEEFQKAMKKSEWLNNSITNKAKTARANVRRLLQESNPQLKRINGNTLNASIIKYITSGNFQGL